ncbi:GGDEF domain-containing protein [Agaribacter marinus]|uniref:diguanylate cyclase n=1 Tax=Agaribacter marinus TaxID=1431249 RepID=A0AA37SUF4_9ALTE|nr:GGDEF domain-containing protein [Agaribacter marinus]GLR69412.1 hypothetical protein GCM10007852_03200 [Agaribacter marinus]
MRRYHTILSLAITWFIAMCVSASADTITTTGNNFFSSSYQTLYAEMQKNPTNYVNSNQTHSFSTVSDFQSFFISIQAYEQLGRIQIAAEKLKAGISASYAGELENAKPLRAIFYEKLSDLLVISEQFIDARQAITNAIEQGSVDFGTINLINRLQKRARIDALMGANIDALQDLQLGFQLANTVDNDFKAAEIALSIIRIHQDRDEHTIAVSYAKKALTILRQLELPIQLSEALVLTANSYISVDDNITALNHLLEAEKLLESGNNLELSARIYKYKARISLTSNNSTQAIKYVKDAIEMSPPEDKVELADLHLLMSAAYLSSEEVDASIEHLVTAFDLIQNQSAPFTLLQRLHIQRAELLSFLGQFEQAYKLTKDILASRELNQPIDEIKRILDMHTNFQLRLQQQENLKLKQENQSQETEIENRTMLTQLYSVIMVLLFLSSILLFLLFIRTRGHRKNLEQIAHRDHLTDLYSRRRIFEILSFQHDMFKRNNLAYCIAIVDLDYFKKINDNYGHQTGDEVLKSFAKMAQECFRKTDSIGRIGGEEFLFIFPETPVQQGERLLNVFSERIRKISAELQLSDATTASVGIVEPSKDEKVSDALRKADDALYKAKENGRDQIVRGY